MQIADPGTCILIGILGIPFFIIGLYILIRGAKLRKTCTARTSGTVDRYEETVRYKTDDHNHINKEVSQWPYFRYTANGTEHILKSTTGGNPSKMPVGSSVTVLFNPQNPESFYVEGHDKDSLFGGLFMAIGAFTCIAGIAGAVYGYMG
jgi:hypothetical protein